MPALADGAHPRQAPPDVELVKAAGGSGSISTQDLNTALTPADLFQTLLGPGIAISNVVFTGEAHAAGTFHADDAAIIGFNDGIILSSGNVADVEGPNQFDNVTTENVLPGDPDLDNLIPGFTTQDATVLECDFIPDSPIVRFNYVFTSDEYNEFVNSEFNDVFGFFLDGNNIALIPATSVPVAINNVHSGNPYDPSGTTGSYPEYYRNNDLDDGGGLIDTEMDGLTTMFTAVATGLTPGATYHLKLAIADAGDFALDSNVFIEAESFVSGNLTLSPQDATNCTGTTHTVEAQLLNAAGQLVEGVEVTFEVTGVHTESGTGITDAMGKANFTYAGTNAGMDTITATCIDPDTAVGMLTATALKTSDTAVVLTATAHKTWETCEGSAIPGIGNWGIAAMLVTLCTIAVLVLRNRQVQQVQQV